MIVSRNIVRNFALFASAAHLTIAISMGLTSVAAAQTPTFRIDIPNMSFAPKQAAIEVGTEVTWTNSSTGIHTVTFNQALARLPDSAKVPVGVDPFDSGPVRAGQTFKKVFTIAGEYKYFCRPHETMGHLGELVVIAAQPAAVIPALPEPPADPEAPVVVQAIATLHGFSAQEVKWVNAAASAATIVVTSASRNDEQGAPLVLIPAFTLAPGAELPHTFEIAENAVATISLEDGRSFTHSVKIWSR